MNDQYNDELLYRTFGKAAEVLIDHAWGYEPLTIQDIKAYEPKQHCLCVGQLLMKPYTFAQSQVILSEMSDEIALKLAGTHQLAQELNLSIHYDEKTFAWFQMLMRSKLIGLAANARIRFEKALNYRIRQMRIPLFGKPCNSSLMTTLIHAI